MIRLTEELKSLKYQKRTIETLQKNLEWIEKLSNLILKLADNITMGVSGITSAHVEAISKMKREGI